MEPPPRVLYSSVNFSSANSHIPDGDRWCSKRVFICTGRSPIKGNIRTILLDQLWQGLGRPEHGFNVCHYIPVSHRWRSLSNRDLPLGSL